MIRLHEADWIAVLAALAPDPAARGLADDAAVLQIGGECLVVTHDVMVEGVHWSPGDDPAGIAWKLVAVNLSDLAAKGAEPLGVLLGFALGDAEWDRRFAEGLGEAVVALGAPLLGGDTVRARGPRSLGMTALGRASCCPVPSRAGARPGDLLCVTGTIGDAYAGFMMRHGHWATDAAQQADPVAALNRPMPRLAEGKALADQVRAMMDVSDGLLIDAQRMAAASGCAVVVELDDVPLSPSFRAAFAQVDRRLEAASWGDDYQLLFAWDAAKPLPDAVSVVGSFVEGEGLILRDRGARVPLPERLGYEH